MAGAEHEHQDGGVEVRGRRWYQLSEIAINYLKVQSDDDRAAEVLFTD
jgi:hypothetical protein